ncbi:AAA family ATPase [[Clostridium] polysaccharolyticum]|uniref:Predicted ATP-binding protein involved in virulence n=1 Tax=[Clostridium] polysaccharolyticum TaxID=29364 RepID=A0A1I0BRN3_9FIRM|nr:AAA family ATPase [[Clostridium] polysaccharolyticum]SET09614.1 Predicted ATP-binding protein involved in virulence [[Clostridium] polysaccharolyticum]
MKIRSVELKNFRSLSSKKLTFTDVQNKVKQFTVLIGDNGAGKTSFLEAITKSFVPIIRSIDSKAVKNCDLKDSDIKYECGWTTISTEAEIDGKKYMLLNKKRITAITEYDETINLKEEKQQKTLLKDAFIKKREQKHLPLILYYGTNRVFNEVPRRGHIRDYTMEDALESCFDNTNNFRGFYEWFKKEEDIELRELRHQKDYKNVPLNAVRDAISSMIPGYRNLRIELNPSRMVITNESGEDLRIEQLSGGYKAVLAVVSDIAKRLAMANPTSINPLEDEAVILIDELDLHLHPKWQKTIVADLKRTFPNCQFIVSTHSPFIIQSLKQSELLDLENEDVPLEDGTFEGWSIEEIQENKMNVECKTERYKEMMIEFSDAVDEEKKDRSAKAL